jgi:Zn-dependent protease
VLGGEPQPTQFDLNFTVLGVPVRLSAWFWLGTLLFGSGLFTEGLDGMSSGIKVLLWVTVCFISILLHELGHAMAFRRFRIPSRIVLHAFGGLAIPDTYSNPWQISTARVHPQHQLIISAAGPLVQLLLASTIIALLHVAGYNFWVPDFLDRVLHVSSNTKTLSLESRFFFFTLMLVNIYWPLLNLIPVYPLDGGQIARSLFLINNVPDAIRNSLMLSMIVGGAMAFYGLQSQQIYLAFLFGSMAASNYQMWAMHRGRF